MIGRFGIFRNSSMVRASQATPMMPSNQLSARFPIRSSVIMVIPASSRDRAKQMCWVMVFTYPPITVRAGGSVTSAICLLRTPTRGRNPSSRAAESTRLRVAEGINALLLNTRLTVPAETRARLATCASTPEAPFFVFVSIMVPAVTFPFLLFGYIIPNFYANVKNQC